MADEFIAENTEERVLLIAEKTILVDFLLAIKDNERLRTGLVWPDQSHIFKACAERMRALHSGEKTPRDILLEREDFVHARPDA